MTQRREQTVRLAEILGIEFEPSVGTVELMDLCIAECEGRSAGWGQEPDESESENAPEGFRPALRSVPAPGSSGSSAGSSGSSKHRPGGNSARKLREANARYDQEQRVIAQLGEVEHAQELGEEAAEGEADEGAVEPALAASRSGARRGGPRRGERQGARGEARKAS